MPIYEISIWIDAMYIYLEREKTSEGRKMKTLTLSRASGKIFYSRSSNNLITVRPFNCIPMDFQSLHCSLNNQFLVSLPPPLMILFSFASLQNISSRVRNSWFLWTYIIYFTSCTTHNHVEALICILPLPEVIAIQKSTLSMAQYPNVLVLQHPTF